MSFHYTPNSSPDDVTFIRYHLADTDADAAIWQDEEIIMAVAVAGSKEAAVVSLIEQRIAQIAQQPDMTADWLTISNRRSADQWETLLQRKKVQFGLNVRSAGRAVPTYRADSLQTDADYEES